jgi:hypothetical protein
MADRVTRVHNLQFIQELALKFTAPGMVADKICPRVPVKKQADKYRIWGKDRFVHRGANAAKWAAGTAPNEITMRFSEDQYFAELFKLRMKITDTERRNADNDLQLDANGTEYVTLALQIAREARVATMFTTAATSTRRTRSRRSGGSEYDVAGVLATNQILKDIDSMVSQIKLDALCSSKDITVVIPDMVFDKGIKRCAGILDDIKYVQKGIVTADLLAELLDIKEVVIAQSMSVTPAVESEGSDVLTGYTSASLWSDNIWIGIVPPAGNAMQPGFARTFGWNVETGGQDREVRVYRDSDEGTEATGSR